MKTGKRILSILLVVLLLLTAAPLAGFVGLEIAPKAKALAATGYCGSNVSWSFNPSAGALTISGTGKMWNYNYSDDESPFFDHVEIKSIKINNGITSIGNCAFWGCSDLTSVTIPNSVTSIGWNAFCDCSSLISVTIPNSVTSIGLEAFCECSSLTSVIIPNKVTSIEDSTFDGCSSLTSVTISNSVTSIGEYAFSDCSSLTSITIPNSVSSIDFGAFMYCSSLTSVTISNSVTSIGEDAFCDCSSLTSITIPNSISSIKDGTFSDCSSLTSVIIPNSVTYIGYGAFTRCSNLKDIYYSGTQTQWYIIDIKSYNNPLTNATIHYNSTNPNNPDNPDNPDNPHSSTTLFYEKSYIADIWLNQHKGVSDTVEHKMINELLGYSSLSTNIANEMKNNEGMQRAIAGWKGLESLFKTAEVVGDVTNGRRAFFETLIFALLEKVMATEEYKNILLKSVELLGKAEDAVSPYEKFLMDLNGLVGNGATAFANLKLGDLKQLDMIKTLSKEFGDTSAMSYVDFFMKEANSVVEFFELVASFQMAVQMSKEMQSFLTALKAKTDDPDFNTALFNVLQAVNNANWASAVCTIRFVENTSEAIAQKLLDFAMKSNPVTGALKLAYDASAFLTNLLFNTSDIVDMYFECDATRIFVEAAKEVIVDLGKKYKSTGSDMDAGAFVYAMRAYQHIYAIDLEQALKMAKAATEDGVVNFLERTDSSLISLLLKGGKKTTYAEMMENIDGINRCISLAFDYLDTSWIYNTDYLQTDYPTQYDIYVKEELKKNLYAPRVLSTHLTESGKTYVEWFCPFEYVDKNNVHHPLYGTSLIDKVIVTETINGTSSSTSVNYAVDKNSTTVYNGTKLNQFPKVYSVKGQCNMTGTPSYTDSSSIQMDNPCKKPVLLWTKPVSINSISFRIADSSSSRYNNITYHVYRQNGSSFEEIKTINRNNVIGTYSTVFTDTTAKAGQIYTYKVKSEMKFTTGKSIFSEESNVFSTCLSGTQTRPMTTIKLQTAAGANKAPVKVSAQTVSDASGSNGVRLEWEGIGGIPQVGNTFYTTKYLVYRKASYETEYKGVKDADEPFDIIPVGSDYLKNTFFDVGVDPGVEYSYSVIAVDIRRVVSRIDMMGLPHYNSYILDAYIFDPIPVAEGTIKIPIDPSKCSHTYTSTVTAEPTCTADGETTYTCTICGDTYTEPIPATGNHVDDNNDGKCDTCNQKMTGGKHCKYCGKIHGGAFGWLVKFFHSIFAIFKR